MRCIYLTINKVNGRAYIGQTKLPIRKRYIGSGRVFKLAKRKYGFDSFDFHILENVETQHDADLSEKDFIAIFRCIGVNLYNVADGGNNGGGGPVSAETRDKIRQAHLGKKLSAKHVEAIKLAQLKVPKEIKLRCIEKMRETMVLRGMPPARLGKKNSDEHKRKYRETCLGSKISAENLRKRLETYARKRELGIRKGPYKGKSNYHPDYARTIKQVSSSTEEI